MNFLKKIGKFFQVFPTRKIKLFCSVYEKMKKQLTEKLLAFCYPIYSFCLFDLSSCASWILDLILDCDVKSWWFWCGISALSCTVRTDLKLLVHSECGLVGADCMVCINPGCSLLLLELAAPLHSGSVSVTVGKVLSEFSFTSLKTLASGCCKLSECYTALVV